MPNGRNPSKSKRKARKSVDYSNLAALWDQFLSMYEESVANPARAKWDATRQIWYQPRSEYLVPRGAFGQTPGAFDYSQYDRWGNLITTPEAVGPEMSPVSGGARNLYPATNYMAPLQAGAYPPPITTQQSIANWYKARNDLTPGVPGVGRGGGVTPPGVPNGYDVSWAKTNEGFWNRLAWETFSRENMRRYEASGGQDAGTLNRYGQPLGYEAPMIGARAGGPGYNRSARKIATNAMKRGDRYSRNYSPGIQIGGTIRQLQRKRRQFAKNNAIDRGGNRRAVPVNPGEILNEPPTPNSYYVPNDLINWRV